MENVHSLFKRVRRIELQTRKLVAQLVGGDYSSIFRGQGMEFSDLRQYSEGDDPKVDLNAQLQQNLVQQKAVENELNQVKEEIDSLAQAQAELIREGGLGLAGCLPLLVMMSGPPLVIICRPWRC